MKTGATADGWRRRFAILGVCLAALGLTDALPYTHTGSYANPRSDA
jgi:hypothetical protein